MERFMDLRFSVAGVCRKWLKIGLVITLEFKTTSALRSEGGRSGRSQAEEKKR